MLIGFAMMRSVLGPVGWESTLQTFLARHDRGAAVLTDFVDLATTGADDTIEGIARWSHLVGQTGVDVGLPTIDASESLARSCLEYFGRRIA